ncbi:inositol 2-dehydrogenase [Candidatus Epulonipiscium viviparus]|uniref:inositol 2-dehydrogenase n=1 Tax=Candidatus Epulonipiscium viviparus TaxID=420336 RepID=UPI0027380995|nr:inositol 2-dehydrogenase [Candidatus Epulopiscium viviparus]
MLKLGMLGAGRIGRLHGNNIAKFISGATLEAIADPYLTEDAREWAKGLGVQKIYTDPAKIFADPEIDAVLICSSTDTHSEFLMKAAAAKKHIFCEKPIDLDTTKIKEAIKAAEQANIKLMVGFVRRFDRDHAAVGEVVKSGQLGKPHIVKITSRDPEAPPLEYVKISGGIFSDMMIHDFDMARFLVGSEVTEVTTIGNICINPDIAQYDDVDTAIVSLKFENGAIGVIDNSRAARYGYDQRVEVHCDKGSVADENNLENHVKISTADGVEIAKPTWFFLERYNDAFVTELQDFVDAVLNDTEVPTNGFDGLMSVYIAQAAKMSLDQKRTILISELTH